MRHVFDILSEQLHPPFAASLRVGISTQEVRVIDPVTAIGLIISERGEVRLAGAGIAACQSDPVSEYRIVAPEMDEHLPFQSSRLRHAIKVRRFGPADSDQSNRITSDQLAITHPVIGAVAYERVFESHHPNLVDVHFSINAVPMLLQDIQIRSRSGILLPPEVNGNFIVQCDVAPYLSQLDLVHGRRPVPSNVHAIRPRLNRD